MASEISEEEMAIMREMCMEGDVAAQFALGRFLKEIPQRGEPGEFKKWLTMAAENGSGPACWEFAEAYLYGICVEQDFAAAHTWLKKGAELNNAACLYNLGVQYLQGDGTAQDHGLAFKCFERSAELGEINGLYNLAACFFRGVGTPVNYEIAKQLTQGVIQAGDPRGYQLMGAIQAAMGTVSVTLSPAESRDFLRSLYEQQMSGMQDEFQETAAALAAQPATPLTPAPINPFDQLKATANNGNVDAQLELAKTLRGKGDHNEAATWFAKAAETGNAEATFELGNCYAKGQGFATDLMQAKSLYQKAEELGHPKATSAVKWSSAKITQAETQVQKLATAAANGDVQARFELGMFFAGGSVYPPDFAAAAAQIEQAAAQNHADAQFAMFSLYQNGQGIAKDMKQAFAWLTKAAAQGHGKALFFFGRRYADGRITQEEIPNAAAIFEKCQFLYPDLTDPAAPKKTVEQLFFAANQGDLRAMYLMAMALFEGDGLAPSPEKGLQWLQKAAAMNYPAAQFELARRYGIGDGIEQDFATGKTLATKAASQGYAEAEMMLATLFAEKK